MSDGVSRIHFPAQPKPRRRFLQATIGLAAGLSASRPLAGRNASKPLLIDNHAHVGGLEPVDFVEGYDPNIRLGLSHLRMLRVLQATGVNMALLHSLRPWANKYHARVVREYPDKFLAVCKLDEPKTHTTQELDNLQMYVREWGFKGLYYDPPPGSDPHDNLNAPKYESLWKLLQELRVPVSFVSYGRSYSSISYSSNFETLWPILLKLMDRFPDLSLVIVHGISPFRCLQEDGSVVIPESAVHLVKNFDVVMDVLPRTTQDYGRNDQVIRSFYETFGASKLAWGTEFIKKKSDTPEEYSRRRYYLQRRCPYLSSEDLQLIMGGNVQRIYDLA